LSQLIVIVRVIGAGAGISIFSSKVSFSRDKTMQIAKYRSMNQSCVLEVA